MINLISSNTSLLSKMIFSFVSNIDKEILLTKFFTKSLGDEHFPQHILLVQE